jgi:CheY-like chemotaxis protein
MTSFVYFEDDYMSRQVMEVILTLVLDHKDVTIFDDSADFMAKVAAMPYKPDIFFLDIHMQPHNGFEVLKQLRENPLYDQSRIVALTASVMNEEVELLRTAGFDGVIGKPVDQRTFPGLLSRILTGEKVWNPA